MNEADLEAYMIDCLGDTATKIGLVAIDLDETVTDIIYDYGSITTVDEATDLRKLRILAKARVFERAMAQVAADYDFSDKSASYSRSQMHKALQAQYKLAQAAALEFAPFYKAKIITPVHVNDPYKKSSEDFTVSDVTDL